MFNRWWKLCRSTPKHVSTRRVKATGRVCRRRAQFGTRAPLRPPVIAKRVLLNPSKSLVTLVILCPTHTRTLSVIRLPWSCVARRWVLVSLTCLARCVLIPTRTLLSVMLKRKPFVLTLVRTLPRLVTTPLLLLVGTTLYPVSTLVRVTSLWTLLQHKCPLKLTDVPNVLINLPAPPSK